MHQLRPQTGLLDLLHNPVPIGRGLQRYRGAGLATGQHPPDRPRRVLQTILPNSTRRHLLVLDPGVVLVTVKRDIFFHARLLSSSKNPFHRQPTLTPGVALSYFHSAVRESAHGPHQSITQVVFPITDLFAATVFADAGQGTVLEVLLENTVLQRSV